MSAIDPVVDV